MDAWALRELCSRVLYKGFSFQSASVCSVCLVINDYWLATNSPISLLCLGSYACWGGESLNCSFKANVQLSTIFFIHVFSLYFLYIQRRGQTQTWLLHAQRVILVILNLSHVFQQIAVCKWLQRNPLVSPTVKIMCTGLFLPLTGWGWCYQNDSDGDRIMFFFVCFFFAMGHITWKSLKRNADYTCELLKWV